MTAGVAQGPSRSSSASASALLFESQGSMMLRMAMGSNSLQNEVDPADTTSSSSGDIRLRQLRESQLEAFPTAPSVHLNLETFNGAEQSYASPSRVTQVSAAPVPEDSVQERPEIIQDIGEYANDPQRRGAIAVTRDSSSGMAHFPPHAPPPAQYIEAANAVASKPGISPGKPIQGESRQCATSRPKRRLSVGSVDSFIGDQGPRNAGDYIRQRTRAEEEAELLAKEQRGFHPEAPRTTHAESPSERPQARDESRGGVLKETGMLDAEGGNASSHSWSKIPPSPQISLHHNGLPTAQGTILVQATPTNTNTSPSRSSGISASFSQPPAPSDSARYPPGTGPLNPPFMRPTSSLDTSSRPWTETSQRAPDHPEQLSPQPVSGPSLANGPSCTFPPATPERRPEGATGGANILITPTQPSIAPAPRLRAREVDADTLSRMRSNTTGSEMAVRSMGSEDFLDVVPETRDNSSADDGVKVDILLPAFTPVSSKGNAEADARSEHPTSDRPSKRRRTEVGPPGDDGTERGDPESSSPAERLGARERTRRGSLAPPSLPMSPARESRTASMKRKAPSPPANESPARSSSPDVPLASLPNVEKDRGRKTSIQERIKAGQKRRLTSPRSENEAESEETEHSGEDDNSSGIQNETEALQAVPEASGSENEALESSDPFDEKSLSPSESDDTDEDYVYEDSQVPGPGKVDGFGIKRKRGSYASVSPAKSSRKRARMREEQENSPTRGKSISTTANPKIRPGPDVLRVFAPWHRDKQFYLGRVIARTKKEEYAVLFDDGEMSHVPLARLRSEVVPGDRVKIISHKAQWAEVTSVSWRKRGGQYITAKIVKSGESVTVRSQFVSVPKDKWSQDRHISLQDIPQTITKAVQSPLHLRSKHLSGTEPPPTPLKVKPEPNPTALRKPTSMDQHRKMSSSRGAKLLPQMSAMSVPGSDAALPLARLPPSQIKQAFARTIIIMSGIEERLKASLIPRIRRGGGKIVEDWLDILSFGSGHSSLQWRGVVKEGDVDQILVLSREATQFPKYMMALAIGVPCISIQWALDRLEGVDVNWHGYLHIAGKLERTGQFVSQVFDPRWGHDMGNLNDFTPAYPVRQPFQNLGFLLVFSSKQDWKLRQDARRVISAAGAESAELVTSVDQAKEPIDSYDFVVTDTENKSFTALVQSAGAKKCVNTAWVRQCIIAGALQPV